MPEADVWPVGVKVIGVVFAGVRCLKESSYASANISQVEASF
jgi:hypothetical protein